MVKCLYEKEEGICGKDVSSSIFEWVWNGSNFIPVCGFCHFLYAEKISFCEKHAELFLKNTSCPKEEK